MNGENMQRRSLFKVSLTAALAAAVPAVAFAADFKEGTDYVKLAKPLANANGTVIKVFPMTARSASATTLALTRPLSRKSKSSV